MTNLEASLKAFIDTAKEIAVGGETAHLGFRKLSISLKRLINGQKITIERGINPDNSVTVSSHKNRTGTHI